MRVTVLCEGVCAGVRWAVLMRVTVLCEGDCAGVRVIVLV